LHREFLISRSLKESNDGEKLNQDFY